MIMVGDGRLWLGDQTMVSVGSRWLYRGERDARREESIRKNKNRTVISQVRTDHQGFDEFMNVVIDETLQIYQPKKDGGKAVKEPEELGRILLKGEFGLHFGKSWIDRGGNV
jgi:small nuclear ribonucleoprotein (snRNP)-like protein